MNNDKGYRLNQYCPYSSKFQLVSWAIARWPSQPSSKFKNMKKKQLYAIYYNAFREINN